MNLLYEKLQSTYRETIMHQYFPSYLLEDFYKFVQEHQIQNKKYLSPYKFANDYRIKSDDSVQFFLFLTGEDRPLKANYFLECSNHSCGHRIFFSKDELIETIENGFVICEECEKYYSYDDISGYIKVYFTVNMDDKPQNYDPNSTFDAIKDMNAHLKVLSPSSQSDINVQDEGDELNVKLKDISHLNKTNNGEIISPSLEEVLMMANEFIKE